MLSFRQLLLGICINGHDVEPSASGPDVQRDVPANASGRHHDSQQFTQSRLVDPANPKTGEALCFVFEIKVVVPGPQSIQPESSAPIRVYGCVPVPGVRNALASIIVSLTGGKVVIHGGAGDTSKISALSWATTSRISPGLIAGRIETGWKVPFAVISMCTLLKDGTSVPLGTPARSMSPTGSQELQVRAVAEPVRSVMAFLSQRPAP